MLITRTLDNDKKPGMDAIIKEVYTVSLHMWFPPLIIVAIPLELIDAINESPQGKMSRLNHHGK